MIDLLCRCSLCRSSDNPRPATGEDGFCDFCREWCAAIYAREEAER